MVTSFQYSHLRHLKPERYRQHGQNYNNNHEPATHQSTASHEKDIKPPDVSKTQPFFAKHGSILIICFVGAIILLSSIIKCFCMLNREERPRESKRKTKWDKNSSSQSQTQKRSEQTSAEPNHILGNLRIRQVVDVDETRQSFLLDFASESTSLRFSTLGDTQSNRPKADNNTSKKKAAALKQTDNEGGLRSYLSPEANSFLNLISYYFNGETSCLICLSEYEIGDKVCWSRNTECIHAFHLDCIMEWLNKRDDCPCCRRRYILPGVNHRAGIIPKEIRKDGIAPLRVDQREELAPLPTDQSPLTQSTPRNNSTDLTVALRPVGEIGIINVPLPTDQSPIIQSTPRNNRTDLTVALRPVSEIGIINQQEQDEPLLIRNRNSSLSGHGIIQTNALNEFRL